MVPVTSIIALLVILAGIDWEWIETEDKVEFTHSIFGIVAISFAFIQVYFILYFSFLLFVLNVVLLKTIQPFMALLRCRPDSRYRFIFNYLHRSVGLLALLFASKIRLYKNDVLILTTTYCLFKQLLHYFWE